MKSKKRQPVDIDIPNEGISFDEAVEAYEKVLLLAALNKTNWVKSKAAKLLKVKRTTLIHKLKRKGLHKPRS